MAAHVLHDLAPGIQQQVAVMLAHNAVAGLEVAPLPLPDPGSLSAMPRPATRFSLEFQHCLERVRWQVVMQRRGAQWAPDFVFTESTFQPLVPGPGGGANAKRLAEALGAVGSPQQLAHIVSLLLDSYQAHHAARVATVAATDDRLQFELDTTEAEGRQVMLQGTAGAAAIKVVMVLPIPGVELGSLYTLLHPPQHPQQQSPAAAAGDASNGQRPPSRPASPSKAAAGSSSRQQEAAMTPQLPPEAAAHAAALAAHVRLKLVYTVGGASQTSSWAAMAGGGGGGATPQLSLHMPPELTPLLGRVPSLPGWAGGMCLLDFLPAAAEAVQAAVDRAAAARTARAGLLYAIADLAGTPLMIDSGAWWKAKWRIEVQGLVCLLYVAAGAEYPDRLPELTLQADGGRADESRPFLKYTDYNWSPRWAPAEAAARIFAHLEDTAPQWQAHIRPPAPLPIGKLTLPPPQQLSLAAQPAAPQQQRQQPAAYQPPGTAAAPPPSGAVAQQQARLSPPPDLLS